MSPGRAGTGKGLPVLQDWAMAGSKFGKIDNLKLIFVKCI